eukprot:10354593-Alexandrium_andersonii.AAC.1
MLRPFLGPRSSSFDCLKQLRVFQDPRHLESSGELQGALWSPGELREAPESLGLAHLLNLFCLKAGRDGLLDSAP